MNDEGFCPFMLPSCVEWWELGLMLYSSNCSKGFFCLIKDSHIIIITAAKRDAKQMAWDMKDWKLGTLSNSYVIFWS